MEVMKGYKQTEIGLIPEDWDIQYVKDIAQINTGGRNTQDRIDNGLYPFFVRSQTVERINTYSFDGEAILTAGDGVGTGKVFHYINGKFDAHQRVYRISDFNENVKGYFFYLYFSNHFYNRIMQMTAKSSVDSVRMDMIAKMLIPIPTLAEQEAIAEALSDADALIEAVEQLLTKKRQVKQGAMSELLTGKRRLPGFSGEWETKKLGEITEIISGGAPSTRIDEYWNGNINWCTPTDITGTSGKYLDSTEKQITELGLKNSSANLLPKGTLLLCTRATIGEVKIATDVICTNQGFKSLICSNQVNNEFLYYVLLTLKPKLIEKAIGSTFLEITKKQTALIEIRMPSIAEQTAIAEILSDMDAEISALEEKLVKARQVKAGMMSVLLTGRVRLV